MAAHAPGDPMPSYGCNGTIQRDEVYAVICQCCIQKLNEMAADITGKDPQIMDTIERSVLGKTLVNYKPNERK